MSRELINIILLGLSFFLIITPFQTGSQIQQVVVKSIAQQYNIHWNGYYSLCIIYLVFSLSNWLAPSTVSFLGPKVSMIIGGSTYVLFIANFLYPVEFGLYLTSVLLGLGAAIIWTAQGNYLTINSNPDTVSRNSGIFWAIFQCSLLFGNLFVYFEFQGEEEISLTTRLIVYGALSIVGILGIGLLFFLGSQSSSSAATTSTPKEAFLRSIGLLNYKHVWGLIVVFFYTGLFQSFYTGVYGTAIGNTKAFGADSQKLIGISGMLIGAGEIVGGALFGILGSRVSNGKRDTIVVMGFVVQVLALGSIFFNLPFESSHTVSTKSGQWYRPQLWLALSASFLLGFGDACFITQIMSFLSSVWASDSAPIFALFKFAQSIASAVAFFYSNSIGLNVHVPLLAVGAAIGTLSFCLVEWRERRQDGQSSSKANQEHISPSNSCREILTNTNHCQS